MITLKSIKHNKSFSEETLCFTANIYFNGKKIGAIKNGGFGGCSSYSFENGYDMTFLENYIVEKYGDYFKDKLYYVDTFFDYQVLLNDSLSDLKKCLKKTLFIDSDKMMTIKAPFSELMKEKLKKQNPNAILLNDMSLEEAIPLFNKFMLGYTNVDEAMKKIEVELEQL